MSKENNIKLKKKNIIFGIGAVFVIALILFFVFSGSSKSDDGIEEYKGALYESILCQYSCPLKEAKFQNTTQFLPGNECSQGCIDSLKAKDIGSKNYSSNDLLKDGLPLEVDKIIKECRDLNSKSLESLNATGKNASITAIAINTTSFFPCVKDNLEGLKDKYGYLR